MIGTRFALLFGQPHLVITTQNSCIASLFYGIVFVNVHEEQNA